MRHPPTMAGLAATQLLPFAPLPGTLRAQGLTPEQVVSLQVVGTVALTPDGGTGPTPPC